jgi:hypothetical protein
VSTPANEIRALYVLQLERQGIGAGSGPVRALGSETAERARRACERAMVGKRVELSGVAWEVRVVDHLDSTADLVESGGQRLPPSALRHVPLVDVGGFAGCSCGQHVGGGSRG